MAAQDRRLSDATRDAVREHLRQNPDQSLAEIGRQFSISPTSVRKIAQMFGLRAPGANTERTENARKAKIAGLALQRSIIAERLLREAELLIDSLHQPHTAFNFGGKDNTYNEHYLPEPDVKAKQTILTSAAIALDKHVALTRFDQASDTTAAESLLGSLGRALTERFGSGDAHRGESEPAAAE